jgi:hypothetical protein
MTAGLAGDLAMLAALALAPALVALFLLRDRLIAAWPRFWGAMMYGLFGLGLIGVAAMSWVASLVAGAQKACASHTMTEGCGDVRFWLYVAAVPAIGALVAFAIGAAIVRMFGRPSRNQAD